MFKALGRKKLNSIYSNARSFLDLNPNQKTNFSNVFSAELKNILDNAEVSDLGNDYRYFQSKFTELHARGTEKDFGNLFKQISQHAFQLTQQYGKNSESEALNFLAGFMLSMMTTQPKAGQKQLDAMLKGRDGEIYEKYSNFSTEIIRFARENS